MSLAVVLLTVGPTLIVAGGSLALNIRGAATALERWSAANNAELRMHARGDLGPAPQVAAAVFYRYLGSVNALCGVLLPLGGLLELAEAVLLRLGGRDRGRAGRRGPPRRPEGAGHGP
ncbi:hypothetical protein, partial [Streptomyces sp. NPDC048357]|uniref:hypothetical protein n=1 Tax=Streptomyces sp. NPDC048357 TaxID=3154719 RepID=UPI00343FE3C4